MAIINKDMYLRDIALLVGKGGLSFDMGHRPGFEVDGRKVFVGSVSFDAERSALTYTLCNEAGKVYPSARGVRELSRLDVSVLSTVRTEAQEAARLRSRRTRNLVNIESRLREASRRNVPGGMHM